MSPFVAYVSFLDQIANRIGASHDLMHVHAGLAIYVTAQFAIRTRRASMTALHTVFALAVGHEILDYLGSSGWDLADTLKDIGLTVLWPVAITAIGQFRRARWQHEQRALSQLYAHANRAGTRAARLSGSVAPQRRDAPDAQG